MELGQSQQQKQEQHFALTQGMLTALSVLEFSGTDLMEFIQQEAQSNPALDSDEVMKETARMQESIQLTRLLPYHDLSGDSLARDNEPGELLVEDKKSFAEHLSQQIRLLKLSPEVQRTALWIAQSLDENGYLRGQDLNSLSSLPSFHQALLAVQSQEPAGIGARDLTECLILQLHERQIRDPVLEQIVRDDLSLLAAGSFDEINERYQTSDAARYLDLIRTLNPKPAASFYSGAEAVYVIPDLNFERIGGEIRVSLNRALTPKISVSPNFLEMLRQMGPDQRPLYLQYVRRLTGIIDAMEKRNRTLLRLGELIARHQRAHLLGQSRYPLPLTMSEAARQLDLSVSTVSRAVKDKYLAFENALIPLSFFFTRGMAAKDGIASKSEVKDKIRALVERPDPKPISDQKIAELLQKEGYVIQRRTVAKYRKAMQLAGAYERNQKR